METTNRFLPDDRLLSIVCIMRESEVVNASIMADIYEKNIYAFLAEEDTKRLVEAGCEKFDKPIGKEFTEDGFLIRIQADGEVMMQRFIALKFAGWLDMAFFVWAFEEIPELRRLTDSFLKKLNIDVIEK